MSTYTQTSVHIVFSTRDRAPVLTEARREELFRYVWGILKNKHCHLYRIGGYDDHIHILTALHPSIALADLVRDIKVASTSWIRSESVFPGFAKWQDGYAAFNVSADDRPSVIEYIKNQESHHREEDSLAEYKRLLAIHGIDADREYVK